MEVIGWIQKSEVKPIAESKPETIETSEKKKKGKEKD